MLAHFYHSLGGWRPPSLLFVLLLLLQTNDHIFAEGKGGEMAFFNTIPFTENVTHRQHFCDAYSSKQDDWKNALNGLQLNVAIQYGENFDFFKYSTESGINEADPGILPIILDYVADRAGFTWRNSFGVYTSEQREGRNWDDMLTWTTDVYDLSVDKWIKSTARKGAGIAFAESWFDGSFIFVDKTEEIVASKIDLGNWLKPFKIRVWMYIVLTIWCSTIIYTLLEFIGGKQNSRSYRTWFSENGYLTSLLFSEKYMFKPATLATRLFTVSLAFWSWILGSSYTANLASLLVERPFAVETVRNIPDAIREDMSTCIHEGSYSEEYITQEYPEINYFLRYQKEVKDMYKAVNEGSCDLLIGTQQEWVIFEKSDKNPDCNLASVGDPIVARSAGFATKVDPGYKCTGLIHDIFNFYLSEMKDVGLYDEVWEQSIKVAQKESNRKCDESEEESVSQGRRLLTEASDYVARNLQFDDINLEGENEGEDDRLGFTEMAGIFLVHIIGTIIAFIVGLVALWEKRTDEISNSTDLLRNSIPISTMPTVDNVQFSDKVQTQTGALYSLEEEEVNLSDQIKTALSMLDELQDKFNPENLKDPLESSIHSHLSC